MKTYSKYKDSGVEWIGAIPEHWEVKRFKYLFTLSKGLTITKANLRDKGVPCVNYGEIHSKYGFEVDPDQHKLRYVDEEYLTSNPQSLINTGDFVFADTSEDIEGSGNFTYLNSKNRIFAGYHTVIVKPTTRFNSRFFAYVFDSDAFRNQVRTRVKGVKVYSITQTILKEPFLWFPNIEEQQKIVTYLDHKTQQIDQLLQSKAKKIALLQEKRTALINQVVTKGLDPSVEMKDSGVEWIGEIPKHWEFVPLKYFSQVTLGKMLTNKDKGGYVLKPYLRSINVQVENVDISNMREMWFSQSELKKLRLRKGDLLVNEGGDVGRTSIWLDELNECYIQNSVNRVRFDDDIQRYYLYVSLLYHNVGYYDSSVNRVSIPHLTKEKLSAIQFVRPPKSEQELIVKYLDEKIAEIDKTIEFEQQKITLLKEYRQTLISDVVTGKIRVCEEDCSLQTEPA